MVEMNTKSLVIGTTVFGIGLGLGYVISKVVHSQNTGGIPSDFLGLVERFRIEAHDKYGNVFILQPKLTAINRGKFWNTLFYNFVRTKPSDPENYHWVGDYGDVEIHVELWDARKVEGRNRIEYEVNRSGWSEYKVYIDDVQVCVFDHLEAGHPNPSIGYFEGALHI